MRVTAQIKGVDALSLRTKKLIGAAFDGAKYGVSEAALLFVEEAKLQVPVDTGNLRDHIHAELVESKPEAVTVVVTPGYEEPNEYGFDPAYARRIELGFFGADKLGRVYHQEPQPYMRPAHDMHADEARGVIKERIFESLDAAMVKR